MPSQVFATPSCVLAALVFIASRAEGELISLERAADAFRVSAKETRKAYTRCLKTIEGLNDAMVRPSNLQYIVSTRIGVMACRPAYVPSPSFACALQDSLTTALQLPASFNFRLRRLVDTVSKLDIASRHTPRVFIAGCAMLLGTLTPQLAEKHQLSAASLGEAIGTTTKTITAVHQALKKSIPTILKLLSQASKAEPKAADAADSKATANGEGQQGPPTQHISSAASVASAASSSSASSEGTGRAPPTRGSGYHLPTWSSYYMVSGPSLSSLSLTKSRAPESAPPGAEAWDGSQDPLNVDRIPDTEVFATHRPSSVAEAIQRRKGHTATLTLPAKEKEIIPNFRILPSREEVEEEAKAPQPSYDEWTAPSRPSVSASERSRPHGLGYPSRAGGFLNANELPFSMKAEEKAEEYRPAAVKPELPGPQSYIPHLPRPAASLPSSSGPPSFASGLPSASASATPSPSRPRVGRFFRSRVKPERGSASALPPLSELPPLPGLPSLSDSMQSSKRRRVA